MRSYFAALFVVGLLVAVGCGVSVVADEANNKGPKAKGPTTADKAKAHETQEKTDMELTTATFGGGCFWCTEAVFDRLKGVESVTSGYMGGQVENPTYQAVCTGLTGHAEVIQIEYDADVVPFEVLLEVFWKTHDPTTLNRQGVDVGTQYRSVVFYHNEKQKALAEEYKKKLDDAGVFDSPIVTEISPAAEFYEAEDYHQDYYAKNSNQPYCRALIPQKLRKLRNVFGDRLKENAK